LQNILGVVLNLIVLILICNLADGALQHVKTCLVISTVHSILYCGSNHLLVPIHHIIREGYFLTLHGEFLPLLPLPLIPFLFSAWTFLHSLTWTLQPLNFIVQYYVISKKSGVSGHIFCSLVCLSFCLSIPYFLTCFNLFPSQILSNHISQALEKSYPFEEQSFVSSSFIYGNLFEERKSWENGVTMVGFCSSFLLSYSIVLFYICRLIGITRANLLKDRKKSLRAHARVVRWLIAQSLIPFTPLFIMTSITMISITLNLHLPSFSILISILSSSSPIVQGLVNGVQITRWNCSNLDLSHHHNGSRRNTITQSSMM
ncbi:hypothetical protein PMAYCL1PPCAC_17568, partial [Pristionchus mayeri]